MRPHTLHLLSVSLSELSCIAVCVLPADVHILQMNVLFPERAELSAAIATLNWQGRLDAVMDALNAAAPAPQIETQPESEPDGGSLIPLPSPALLAPVVLPPKPFSLGEVMKASLRFASHAVNAWLFPSHVSRLFSCCMFSLAALFICQVDVFLHRMRTV